MASFLAPPAHKPVLKTGPEADARYRALRWQVFLGIFIGYAGFWLVAGEAQVTRVAIAEDERGQGLGTRLTAALVNKAWELGAEAVTLEVRESNVAAQRAYLTCGFASEGVRPNYYEDNHENAVIMWLYKDGVAKL